MNYKIIGYSKTAKWIPLYITEEHFDENLDNFPEDTIARMINDREAEQATLLYKTGIGPEDHCEGNFTAEFLILTKQIID